MRYTVFLLLLAGCGSGSEETQTLLKRIDELEKQIASIEAGEGGGIAVNNSVWAREFVLMDQEGVRKAALGFGTRNSDQYGPGLRVFDAQGRLKFVVFTETMTERTRLVMYDNEGGTIVDAMANGSPKIGSVIVQGLRSRSPVIEGDY